MKKVFNVFICFGFVFLLLCNAGNNCFATNAVCNRTSIKVNKNKGTVEDLIHNNKKIKLDENFYKWTLSKFSNANAKITKIKLKDLQISQKENDCFAILPLRETPSYKFLQGDEQSYKDYVSSYDPDPTHSVERFKRNVKKWEQSFDLKYLITIDADNVIHDGKHRAAWLMHECGEDYEITVLNVPELRKVNKGNICGRDDI